MADCSRRQWLRWSLGLGLGTALTGGVYWLGTASARHEQDELFWRENSARLLEARYPDLTGAMQPLAQWRGQVMVVNFWATWCPPCIEEIPGFIELQRKYRDRGVIFVGVAVDKRDAVIEFTHRLPINYPLLIGGMESATFTRRIGNSKSALPFTAVMDRTGMMRHVHSGLLFPARLEKILQNIV